MGIKLTIDEIDELVNEFDKDGDGEINYRSIARELQQLHWPLLTFTCFTLKIMCDLHRYSSIFRCVAFTFLSDTCFLHNYVTFTLICVTFTYDFVTLTSTCVISGSWCITCTNCICWHSCAIPNDIIKGNILYAEYYLLCKMFTIVNSWSYIFVLNDLGLYFHVDTIAL